MRTYDDALDEAAVALYEDRAGAGAWGRATIAQREAARHQAEIAARVFGYEGAPAPDGGYTFGPRAFEALQAHTPTTEYAVMLMDESFVPDPAKHHYRSDVLADEIVAPGYRAGGAPCMLEVVQAAPRTYCTFGEVYWPKFVATAHGALYYQSTNKSGTQDTLLCFSKFDPPVRTTEFLRIRETTLFYWWGPPRSLRRE